MSLAFKFHHFARTIAIFLLSCIALNANSQGEYLHRGTSGFDFRVSGLYGSKLLGDGNVNLSGLGLGFGFSILGVVDLAYTAGNHNIPEDEFFAGSEKDMGTVVQGGLTIHAVKQSDKFPLSIKGIFQFDFIEYEEINIIERSYYIGFGAYRRAYLADNISVVPGIDMVYGRPEFSDSRDASQKSTDDEVYMVATLPFAFNFIRNHVLFITPKISYGLNNSNPLLTGTLGYILPIYFRKR
jgi:hypothetical protein